jgi:hypothetical protein
MSRIRMFDLIGIVSEIGLLLCFCGAIWLDVFGNEELKRIVGISSAVFLTGLAITFVVYLWDIAKNRRAYK